MRKRAIWAWTAGLSLLVLTGWLTIVPPPQASGQTTSGFTGYALQQDDMKVLGAVLTHAEIQASIEANLAEGPCVRISVFGFLLNPAGDRQYVIRFRFRDAATGTTEKTLRVDYTYYASTGPEPSFPPDQCGFSETSRTGLSPISGVAIANMTGFRFLMHLLQEHLPVVLAEMKGSVVTAIRADSLVRGSATYGRAELTFAFPSGRNVRRVSYSALELPDGGFKGLRVQR